MKFLVKIITTTLAVILAAYVLPGVSVDNTLTAIILAFVLAVLNALIRPLLVLLTLPVTILTLGLFLLVINAVIVLMASALVSGFTIAGFWHALLFSIVLALVVSVLEAIQEGFADNRR